ncbi:MAG: OmcA/MtrC family decaheme c-type cytochrome [Myxococcaceae bacterium]
MTDAGIAWEPTLTHRLGGQSSGTINGRAMPVMNVAYDFVPAGGAVTTTKEMAMTASCNECHGSLRIHGSRIEVKYCVTCHNPYSIDQTTNQSVNMSLMVHGIHSAHMRSADAAPEYKIGNASFAEVTYPQGLENCAKCHTAADTATPQGDSWTTRPNKEACSGCHAKVDFNNHPGTGTVQANNSMCAGCHDSAAIKSVHMNENATPNNPATPSGAYNFTYEIKSVTVNASNQPVIEFRVQRSVSPSTTKENLTLATILTAPGGATLADGGSVLTGSPSFLLAYAQAQDGVSAPIDYNNLGRPAAQPATVALNTLYAADGGAGTKGSLSAPDTNGYYTATLTTDSFPVGSTLRAVALQGYWTQANLSASLARHTPSAFKGVTGDPARRLVVDSAKCANCHEWFEGHGGNRVYAAEVCEMCHVPNLSSSGRTANPANISAATQAVLTAAGFNPANPLTFPEVSNNFKDLIHSAHSAANRTTPFQFVRNRGSSGVYYYDFSEVTFPNMPNNCEACHRPGTYDTSLPSGVLVSTIETLPLTTPNPDGGVWTVTDARQTLPNATDLVTTPAAGVCSNCHDSALAINHMEANGGSIKRARATVNANAEGCNLCHGTGRGADVNVVHKR